MSELTTMRPRLHSLLGDRLDEHWARFRQQEPDGDTSLFLARLRRDGHLTDAEVRDVFLRGEVTITLSEGRPGQRARQSGPRRYHVVSSLGSGAMGEVVLATDPELRRQVALKRLHPHLAEDAALIRRFRTEAQITAQLDHPAIMPVFSFEIEDDGTLSYAMKLIRGGDLDELLHQTRVAHQSGAVPAALGLRSRLETFLHICDAMAYAHDRGVIHRDLKPENVMVGAFHEVTVMDWGIAKLIGAREELTDEGIQTGPAHSTRIGMAIGTPSYMSPEQARGQNHVLTPACDQYALGLILHEVLSLRRANTGGDVMEVVKRAQNAQRDPLRPYSKLESIPRELRATIERACARSPSDRYDSVADFAEDIRRYLRDEPVLAAPDTLLQRVHRWAGRNRGLMFATIGGLIVLGAIVTTTLVVTSGVVIGVQHLRAEARREASEHVLAGVAAQGQAMDAALLRYESLLTGLSYAAEESLIRSADEQERYLSARFDTPDGAPPDLAPSARYGVPISLDHPALHVPDKVNASSVQDTLNRLVAIHPWMWRALLDSAPPASPSGGASRQEIVRSTGLPVVWALVATQDGPMAILPGTGGIPGHIDPRERPWYRGAVAEPGVYWSEPYRDMGGMGLLVSASTALRDRDGELLGVASFDLGVEHLVRDLMAPGDLAPPSAATYLVSDDGRIFLDNTGAQGVDPGSRGLEPELWKSVQAEGKTGQRQVGSQLVTWVRLSVAPWTYVVVGPIDDMLAH